jgi:phosphonoacetaldehyde hydrolase
MELVFRRSYRGPLKAVIVDWAGTVIDYGSLGPVAAFLEVFSRKNVPITMDEAREPMGTHKKDHIRRITEMASVRKRWLEVHDRLPSNEDIEQLYRDIVPVQVECLVQHSELIPGALDAFREFRARRLKTGSTTGYTREMMEAVTVKAREHGFQPDTTITADEVPAGRPAPWMCFQAAMNLQTYPMEALIKAGDTVPDIEEGLNAAMWTVGVVKTGNEMGLTQEEVEALPANVLEERLRRGRERLRRAGAHYVIEGIGDLPPLLDEINARLARGDRP